MNCKNCGTFNENGSICCKNCGTALEQVQNVNNQPSITDFMQGGVQQEQTVSNEPVVQPMVEQQPMVMEQSNQVEQPVVNQGIDNQTNVSNGVVNTSVQSNDSNDNNNATNTSTPSTSNNNGNKFNPKLLLIGGGVLLFIIICVLILPKNGASVLSGGNKKNSRSYEILKDNFDSDNNLIYEKNGKKGFMDKNGKILTDAIYEDIKRVYSFGFAVARRDDMNYLLDKNGKEIDSVFGYSNYDYSSDEHKTFYFNGTFYDYNLKSLNGDKKAIDFEKGYAIVRDGEKYGLMNPKGKIVYTSDKIFKIRTEQIDDTIEDYYCALTTDDNGYNTTFVNCDTGKVVGNYDYYVTPMKNNIFKYGRDKKYCYIQDDKLYIESADSIEYKNGALKVTDESGTYYIDLANGKKSDSLPEKYEKSGSPLEDIGGYKIESCKGKDGSDMMQVVTKGGKTVIGCEWNSISDLRTEISKYLILSGKPYVLGVKDDKTYLIDLKKKKTIEEFDSRSVESLGESEFLRYKTSDYKTKVVYSLVSGKSATFDPNVEFTYWDSYFMAESDGKVDYYNSDCKLVHTENS